MPDDKRIYSFDTSALIDGIERLYPIKNFPGLWERIDGLISEGRLLVSEEVWREATQADAPLKDWCEEVGAGRESCVVRTDAAIGAIAGQIVSGYPTWAVQGGKNGADPFVIAVGEILGAIVVSGEKPGSAQGPKIPYVCGQRKVRHIKFTDVVVAEGWVFG